MPPDPVPLVELSRYALRVRMSAANERWEDARRAYSGRIPEADREALYAALMAADASRREIKAEIARRGRLITEARAKAGAERRERNRLHNVPSEPRIIDLRPRRHRGKRGVGSTGRAC